MAALAAHLCNVGTLPYSGWLPLLVMLASMLAVRHMQATERNSAVRHSALYAFGFGEGWIAAPMVNSILLLDPTAVLMALVSTVLIFVSFTMSAICSPRRQYIYLGGLIGTLVSLMAVATLGNIFVRSASLATAELYIGLFVFSMYIPYHTQVIIERAEGSQGQQDAVVHALTLFTDIASIFVRLLKIIYRHQQGNRTSKRRDDHRRRH